MILIHKTYEVYTQESIEAGESDDAGFVFENESLTFRELVSAMQEHQNPSCYPARGEAREWLSSYPEEDFRTGDTRTESIHYSMDNPERNKKYWKKAMKVAGIIKS